MDFGRREAYLSFMRRTLAALLLAGGLGLTGCGGADRAASPEPELPGVDRTEAAQQFVSDALAGKRPANEAPVPSGFRLRESRADNVALAFPPGWQALTSVDARFPGVMQMFGQLNRGLGSAVAALSMPDGPLKLLGFDPRTTDGFATTASG
jgi:hypothetical protein